VIVWRISSVPAPRWVAAHKAPTASPRRMPVTAMVANRRVPVSIVLADVRQERRDLLRRPGRLLGLRCFGLDGAIGWIVRQQPVHDGVVQDPMRKAVDVRDALGRQALEQLGVVAGEGAPVELLQRDHPEGWDEMVAQVTFVDGEGGFRQLAQVDPRASTLLEPRRRVVPEAQLRRRDVSAPPAIGEFGLHGIERILFAGEPASLDLLAGRRSSGRDVDREGPGEAAVPTRASRTRHPLPTPVHRRYTEPDRPMVASRGDRVRLPHGRSETDSGPSDRVITACSGCSHDRERFSPR
jgi:hypothetical protein